MQLVSFMNCVTKLGVNFFADNEVFLTVQQIIAQSHHSNRNIVNVSSFSCIPREVIRMNDYKTHLDLSNNEFELYICLDLDVKHLKKPFILTGVRFHFRAASEMIIKNVHNNENITKAKHTDGTCPKTFRFSEGVVPNANGKISLQFNLRSNDTFGSYLIMKEKYAEESIIISNDRACVDIIFYQCRQKLLLTKHTSIEQRTIDYSNIIRTI